MKEIEVLNLRNKKSSELGRRKKFVTVENRKRKISASLKKDLFRNYGFKLEDN